MRALRERSGDGLVGRLRSEVTEMTTTTQELQAAMTILHAVAETVREAGEIPSGTMYAALTGRVTLEGYEQILRILTGAGLIAVDARHMIRWVGPELAGRAPKMTIDHHPPQRIIKALQLADTLDAAGLGSADVTAMDAREWLMLAAAARTRRPSPQTRALVLSFLQNRESARAIQQPRQLHASFKGRDFCTSTV